MYKEVNKKVIHIYEDADYCLSRCINFGRVKDLNDPTVIHFLNGLHRNRVVLSFSLYFQFHGIKRIDLDFVITQMDPDPIIALPARLDVFKMFCQGSQDLIKMIPV